MVEEERILELLRGGPSSLPDSVLADSCTRDNSGGSGPQRRLPVTRSNGEMPIHDLLQASWLPSAEAKPVTGGAKVLSACRGRWVTESITPCS